MLCTKNISFLIIQTEHSQTERLDLELGDRGAAYLSVNFFDMYYKDMINICYKNKGIRVK